MPIIPQASQEVGQGIKMTAFIPPHPTMYGGIPSAQDSLNSIALRYFQFSRPFEAGADECLLRESGKGAASAV